MSRRSLRIAKKAESVWQSNVLPVKRKPDFAEALNANEGNARKRPRETSSLDLETKRATHLAEKLGNLSEFEDLSDENLKTADTVGDELQDEVVTVTEGWKKYVGAHVSVSGGIHLAVNRALELGAKSFAMFLRSQRQWEAKSLSAKDAQLFRDACRDSGFSPSVILPHGIYLMNCGSPDDETLQKSRRVLVDELQRCEMLGLTLYNFHPGSTCGKISVEESLDRVGESINLAHKKTKFVITVLENMSCQGNTVGGKFEELKGIIDRVNDKSRVGVCLDTCHAFAAGYDVATEKGFDSMMVDFENIIGIEYLRGVHLNDSKGELGCHLDRHENIGKGKIGLKGFKYLMNDKRFDGIPMILETPCQSDKTYEKEIKYLYSMSK